MHLSVKETICLHRMALNFPTATVLSSNYFIGAEFKTNLSCHNNHPLILSGVCLVLFLLSTLGNHKMRGKHWWKGKKNNLIINQYKTSENVRKMIFLDFRFKKFIRTVLLHGKCGNNIMDTYEQAPVQRKNIPAFLDMITQRYLIYVTHVLIPFFPL